MNCRISRVTFTVHLTGGITPTLNSEPNAVASGKWFSNPEVVHGNKKRN